MKRKINFGIALIFALVISCFSGKVNVNAFSYTYTVSFYSGAQGSFAGAGGIQVRKGAGNSESVSISSEGNKVVVSGLEYGDVVSCDAQSSVSLNDNSKYYVKGIRLSGRDNNTVSYSAFSVNGDQDYVVAYGIPGELAEYTVNYIDAAGNQLAPSRTYYGNVGDEPVIAYLYIDGYIPDSYNQTGKLVSDNTQNVFNFVYSQAATTANIQNAGQGNAAVIPAGGANAAAGNNPGQTNTPDGNPTPGAGNPDGVVVPDGTNTPANGVETPEAQENTNIYDQQVPQAANNENHEIVDSKVPLASIILNNGMVVPIAIGSLAAVALIVTAALLVRSKVKTVKNSDDDMKTDNKN